MTNYEIIENAKIEKGFSKEQIFRTYQGWQRLGYQVNKGEKALFQTKIFFPKFKKNKEDKEDSKDLKGFFMKTASFFLYDQVSKIRDFKEEEALENLKKDILGVVKELKEAGFEESVILDEIKVSYKEDVEEFELDKNFLYTLVYEEEEKEELKKEYLVEV